MIVYPLDGMMDLTIYGHKIKDLVILAELVNKKFIDLEKEVGHISNGYEAGMNLAKQIFEEIYLSAQRGELWTADYTAKRGVDID